MSQHYNIEACLTEMLSRWLKTVNPPPSWKAIIDAVRAPAVGYYHLAKEIEQSVYGHSITDEGQVQG